MLLFPATSSTTSNTFHSHPGGGAWHPIGKSPRAFRAPECGRWRKVVAAPKKKEKPPPPGRTTHPAHVFRRNHAHLRYARVSVCPTGRLLTACRLHHTGIDEAERSCVSSPVCGARSVCARALLLLFGSDGFVRYTERRRMGLERLWCYGARAPHVSRASLPGCAWWWGAKRLCKMWHAKRSRVCVNALIEVRGMMSVYVAAAAIWYWGLKRGLARRSVIWCNQHDLISFALFAWLKIASLTLAFDGLKLTRGTSSWVNSSFFDEFY